MSATLIASATAALTTAATVIVAALPEARDLLSPLTEGGTEFATTAAALFIALPVLAVMTLIAGSAQD
ncbi:MAG: hypothetical protein WBP38_11755 [Hyphomicrobium sp.]|nr:hypothetical protein [Hyphomicrobium sp.]